MFFASDNAGPAHPKVIEAVMRANDGYAMPYGAEDAMARVRGKLRDLLGMPNAAIYLVATGTATNALMLATMCKPFQTIFCSEVAHIEEDECGAPEFFTSGAKLTLVDAPQAKMTAEHLREAIDSTADGVVHGVQRGPVSITTVTERGTVYTLDEQKALVNVAREYGLPVHLDGARFANAVASLGCTAADMAQGFDAISFGATKNGCMGVEAAVFADPAHAWEFELRRKRGGHLFSKHRFLSAQMEAYLDGDLWLEMAQSANAACARLVAGLRNIKTVTLANDSEANMIYLTFPRAAHRRLKDAGAQFYSMGTMDGPDDEPVLARIVCDWSATAENADRFLRILEG
ncbi:Low specificity L-threonine aldolase [Rhodobacteraceae bacterium THAF1]|uniref:threonine aldolase family protein n=1 Tax=Palleronia sp. THAF1 TaxID=2587842 RepID=UPI000F410402|nr:beta-eliminating lyase-related protein [Palleronia sp. THAF1]QFU09626.1 Low specificity L-threonine aldolase [Palleronia sp. THAF1]VDC17473.1 Low specificity L-threonine aldolase [Rhodobacteraceae bacterium THAF1]